MSLKQDNTMVACEIPINGIPYIKDENLYENFIITMLIYSQLVSMEMA